MSAHTWDEYSHRCDSCFNAYMSNPQREPCYSHKGHPGNDSSEAGQGAEEYRSEFGFTWDVNAKPFDFNETPKLLRRLEFLKWVWAGAVEMSH